MEGGRGAVDVAGAVARPHPDHVPARAEAAREPAVAEPQQAAIDFADEGDAWLVGGEAEAAREQRRWRVRISFGGCLAIRVRGRLVSIAKAVTATPARPARSTPVTATRVAAVSERRRDAKRRGARLRGPAVDLAAEGDRPAGVELDCRAAVAAERRWRLR